MIIPIGHEEGSVRRKPWVTFGIMIACFVAFVITDRIGTVGDEREMAENAERLFEYWIERPYLEIPEDAQQFMWESESAPLIEMVQQMDDGWAPEPPSAQRLAEEQAELERLTRKMVGAVQRHPFYRWGLIPADVKPLSLLTHMFLHVGFLHLFGNLLILYLTGPFVEDKWGRPVFLGFYLGCGLAAGLLQIVTNAGSEIPMIGASGAIAGVMGAFLVRYRNTKIKFFYIFGLLWRGTFDAPAYVMLSIWFGEQLLMAMLLSGVDGGGVAYWAHVGGFVAGVGGAIYIRKQGVEERLDPLFDAATTETFVDNPEVERALTLAADGNPDAALVQLQEIWARDRANAEVGLALWGLAVEQERPAEAAPAMVGVIEEEIRRGLHELALTHWGELSGRVPDPPAGPDLLVRVAQLQARENQRVDAATTLRRALIAAGGNPPAAIALRIARAARTIDLPVARGAAKLALARGDLEPLERRQAEQLLA